jgi:two-component system sensor histidine kinase ChiS
MKPEKSNHMNLPFSKKATFIFLFLVCCSTAFSQQKSRIFEQYDQEDGLSSNWVRDIAQDKQGYMWFATSDGLNRFDGYDFKVYQNKEGDPKSLLVNYVRCVFVDNENILWIGYNDGLSRYDAKKDAFAHFTNNPNNLSSISSNKVSDITCDSKGNLWIATKDNGICYLDKNTYKFKSYKNTIDERANSQFVVHCDKKDRLWIGTYTAGMSLFDVKSKKFLSFSEEGSGLEGKFVASIYEGNDGKIWAGTAKDGLYFFDEEKNKFIVNTLIPFDRMIASISQDDEGNIWVSAENLGLYILNVKTNTVENLRHNKYITNSVGHNSINTILKDRNGNIWLGTFASGINLYKVPNNRFGHFFNDPLNPNSLNHNAVLCFTEDCDKNLWIGTDDGGLNKYTTATGKFSFYTKTSQPNSLASNVIISVYEDKRKNIWAGTYLEGLLLMDKKKGTFQKKIPNYSFGSMLEDSESNFWLGGWRDGLFLFNRENNSYKNFTQKDGDPSSISDNFVYYVYEDRRKNVWVCTSVGLNLIEDKVNGRFRRFLHDAGNPNSLGNNTVYHCYEDSKNRFWIGTAGGLCQMNRDSIKFYTLKEKNGLANNNVMEILEDNAGKLWLSTNKGISCFDPETKIFKNYDKSDGLQSNQFSIKAGYKLSSGELLFGGINGYNRFNPQEITINKNAPNVVIKSLQAFETNSSGHEGVKRVSFDISNDITLKSSQSNIIVEYVAFNYTNTKKVKYAYKLEGFESDWNYNDKPEPVKYTNLEQGKYIFKVKAANEDGIWNETGAQITLIIQPPFWATWWFRSIAIIAIGIIAYYMNGRSRRISKKRRKLLENKVLESTNEINKHKEEINALKMELDSKSK